MASQGRWADIQRIADTGRGPHWTENRDSNYDLSSAGDVGPYGSIPGNIPLGQWLRLFLQTYGPHAAVQDPVTGAVEYQQTAPDTAFHPAAAAPVAQPGLPPSPQAPAGAGFSPLLGLGIGAAAIAAVFMATGGRRRQNPRHRHLLPRFTGYSKNRRHRRRSHRRRSGRRRR